MGSTNPNTLGSVLPGSGTSFSIQTPDVNQNLVQLATVTLTSAQILALNGTPVTLIPAPGAGLSILVTDVVARFKVGGAQYAGGGNVTLQYGGGGAAVATALAAAVITGASNVDTSMVIGSSNITMSQNQGITVTNATAAFTTGTGTLTFYIWYTIV